MKKKAGGKRVGAGRKTKKAEVALLERLSVYDKRAQEALFRLIDEGDFKAIQMFYAYRYGKAVERKEITVNKEIPLFDLGDIDDAVILDDESKTED